MIFVILSLGHAPHPSTLTFLCVYTYCDFVAVTCVPQCYMSPQCEYHVILPLQHVAAICPCDMFPRVPASLEDNSSSIDWQLSPSLLSSFVFIAVSNLHSPRYGGG